MKLAGIFIGALAVIALTSYGAYVWAIQSVTLRYRLTLEAEINGRPATGSGVIQVTRQDTTSVFRSMGGVGAIIKGEAVVLDLGEQGSVFALLHGHKVGVAEDEAFPAYVFFHAFKNLFDKDKNGLDQMRMLAERRPKAELPTSLIPLLVRFRDIRDPKSVEVVDPTNFSSTFGGRVTLRRATIEITNDPVTTGIDQTLPWLKQLGGKYLDGGFTSRNAPLGLHEGNFKRGTN